MSGELKPLIAPSVLAANWSNMGAECNRMIDEGADWLHMGKSPISLLNQPNQA